MTADTEKLIEARDRLNAILDDGMYCLCTSPGGSAFSDLRTVLDALEAAEKAHTPSTPTDEEVQRLAEEWADKEFPETPLAPENEQLADAAYEGFCAGFDAGSRRTPTPEPSSEQVRAALKVLEASSGSGTLIPVNPGVVRAALIAAALRRTSVPETSAEPSEPPTSENAYTGIPISDLIRPEQGEPSDAQVYDAETAFWAFKEQTGVFRGAMRAALRAASAVTNQGEGSYE